MSTRVHGHHHVWYSPAVGRPMHVRWFGHGGARILAFPTTMGDHNEWPNRYMPDVLYGPIRRGWFQLWCLDSTHDASWYNKSVHPGERAELWGATLPVEEVAAVAGTLPYELVCGISQRVPIELA